MHLPPIKRLVVSDFKGQEEWIGRLLYPINQVFLALNSGLQKNITITENLAEQIYSTTFQNTATSLSAQNPLQFKFTFSNSPVGLLVVGIQDLTIPGTVFTTAVFPTWSYSSSTQQISVSGLTGLTANHSYQITFRAF